MTRSQTIASRMREVLLNGRWIANTNYQEHITQVTRQEATRKIGNLNTIAALTFHINYYLEGILNVFNGGGQEINDKYSFDLPPIETDEDWEKLVASFLHNAEMLCRYVEQVSDEQLAEPFVLEKYGDYERNMEGVIEHGYYHLGQISLLRKMM